MQINPDYFAELYVAGLFTSRGWNIYFPHRDHGFDFIISKNVNNMEIIRPVQVKGKYPSDTKKNRQVYGFVGELSKLHPDMILAIPFFNKSSIGTSLIAYMPRTKIKVTKKGYRCEPAQFKNGTFSSRRDFKKYFNENGLDLIETLIDFK